MPECHPDQPEAVDAEQQSCWDYEVSQGKAMKRQPDTGSNDCQLNADEDGKDADFAHERSPC